MRVGVLAGCLTMVVACTPFAVMAAPAPAPSSTPVQTASTRAALQQIGATFLSAEAATLWERLSPELQKLIGSQQALKTMGTTLPGQLGPETKVCGERFLAMEGAWVYARRSTYEKAPGQYDLVVGMTAAGEIRTLGLHKTEPYPPEAASPYQAYETKTKLRLPFDGEWYVFWGGRTVAQNYHAAYPDQRYAYDLEVVRDGASHSRDGKKNTDYYCYGLAVLAPADGVVVKQRNDLPDNEPGKMDPQHAAGNYVCIDHGNGEFSMLCHLQPGSVTVRAGDRVTAGQKLGLAGNSGNTSEPHLHYHLQTTATLFEGLGLPPQFQDYLANGERIARGEPVQGQFVRPVR